MLGRTATPTLTQAYLLKLFLFINAIDGYSAANTL